MTTSPTLPIRVQKYGGSSLATPEHILKIAQRISKIHGKTARLLIVVSAMGKTTDDLIALAKLISPHPNLRELDMLLTTGERVSMALVSIALSDLGIEAISFTGSQAGIFTDAIHSHARIVKIKPLRVEEELNKQKTVILAGFQGVNPETKEITTLGRGGSDTTAVAMAAALHAEKCEILKDVPGILTGDPKIVQNPQLIKELSYNEMLEMCFYGAKVLHFRSVELAKHLQIPILIGPAHTENSFSKNFALQENGTMIHDACEIETQEILAVHAIDRVDTYEWETQTSNTALKDLSKVFLRHSLPWPQILAMNCSSGIVRMMLTGDAQLLNTIQNYVPKELKAKVFPHSLSCVAATARGSLGTDLMFRVTESLEAHAIPIEKMIPTPLGISLYLKPEFKTRAQECLHKMILQQKSG